MKAAIVLAVILALWTEAAHAQCRQALALGVDVSGSVDADEYRLQLDGIASALEHPEVQDAILSMPSAPVRIAIYEWSGVVDQRLVQGWTPLTDATAIRAVAGNLRRAQRTDMAPATALGTAMQHGAKLLATQQNCWKRTLDISGDGKANTGPRPRDVVESGRLKGITINALVIGADAPDIGDIRQVEIGELSAYFRANVLHGPDAFVETALGFTDYERAMTRKLLRELETFEFSMAPDIAQ